MIRVAEAHMIEEDDPMILRERRPDVPPHRLVAAEAVREEHRLPILRPMLDDVVASPNPHASPKCRRRTPGCPARMPSRAVLTSPRGERYCALTSAQRPAGTLAIKGGCG